MTNLNFLVAAYTVFFILLFAFTARMSLRQKHIDQKIEDLRKRLDSESGER